MSYVAAGLPSAPVAPKFLQTLACISSKRDESAILIRVSDLRMGASNESTCLTGV
jgi:hypothetical protein